MTTDEPRYWFPAKRFGWGWGLPVTWQGWLVTAGYLGAVLGPLTLGKRGEPVTIAAAVILTPALVLVCWRKGEPPRWRWGGR